MTHLRRLALLTVLSGLWLLGGCMKQTVSQPLGPEDSWQKARQLYERGRWYRSQEVLRDILLNYPGSAMIDSVQFLIGRCSFEMGDYLAAADEFQRAADKYPFSKLVGDAVYWNARSFYAESPAYQLDQDHTNKALQGFQRFLEDYPSSALTDSGYHYLALCREKLARKEYAAAVLYHDLGEYASAVLYADLILDNYYDTPLAGPAQFLKGRSFFELHDWERAQKELQTYLDKYPDGRFAMRARQMLSQATERAGPAALSQP
jgi:outer membrane protein assembly factor BamD